MRSQRLSSISLQVPFSWLGRPISSAQWDRILASYISKIYQIHFVLSDTALVRGLILLSQGHAVSGARPNPCYQGHAALTKEKHSQNAHDFSFYPGFISSKLRNEVGHIPTADRNKATQYFYLLPLTVPVGTLLSAGRVNRPVHL